MNKHKLLIWPHPLLNFHTSNLDSSEFGSQELKDLVVSMFDLLHKYGGIGLAANQIGLNKNLFVADLSSVIDPQVFGFTKPKVFINPVIQSFNTASELEEGCLSFPGVTQKVKRHYNITVTAYDIDGNEFTEEANGLYAHVLQHEMEHLNGITLYNHMSALRRDMTKRKINKLQKYLK